MHLGFEKTLDKVYDFYWFDNMSKYVKKFVDNCITCTMSKSTSGKIQAELHPIPKSKYSLAHNPHRHNREIKRQEWPKGVCYCSS